MKVSSFRMLLRYDVFGAVPFHLSNRITVSFKEQDENGIENACDVILEVTAGLGQTHCGIIGSEQWV